MGLDVRVLATGDDVAIGSPILLSAILDELGDSIEKGLVCSDMVDSKNDEEKLADEDAAAAALP